MTPSALAALLEPLWERCPELRSEWGEGWPISLVGTDKPHPYYGCGALEGGFVSIPEPVVASLARDRMTLWLVGKGYSVRSSYGVKNIDPNTIAVVDDNFFGDEDIIADGTDPLAVLMSACHAVLDAEGKKP